jgi:hypothetical protein
MSIEVLSKGLEISRHGELKSMLDAIKSDELTSLHSDEFFALYDRVLVEGVREIAKASPMSPEPSNSGGSQLMRTSPPIPSPSTPVAFSAINDVAVIFPDRGEVAPDSYTVLRKTVTGKHQGDLNKGSGGLSVLLGVRRVPVFAALPTADLFATSGSSSPPLSASGTALAPFSTIFGRLPSLPEDRAREFDAAPTSPALASDARDPPSSLSLSPEPATVLEARRDSVDSDISTDSRRSSGVVVGQTRTARSQSFAPDVPYLIPPPNPAAVSPVAWFQPITGIQVCSICGIIFCDSWFAVT